MVLTILELILWRTYIMAKKKTAAAKKPAKKTTKKKSETTKKAEETTTGSASGPIFKIVGQYAKDVSFECPAAPFRKEAAKQDLSLEVGLEIKGLSETEHEVVVKLKSVATSGEGDKKDTLFVAEVAYAGVFHLENIPQEKMAPIMAIDGASLLFPFARSILMQAITNGGFRPAMIEPINFHALYMQSQQNAQQGQPVS
jgi:preprotein translocase subunit SecB